MPERKYSKNVDYEKKLARVMERLAADRFSYDWTRNDCHIEFFYKGQCFRFQNSLEKAKAEGNKVCFVGDLFAQLVLSLESLAHIICDFHVYDLTTWAAGMKALPAPKNIPHCFVLLGFKDIPSVEQVKQRFHALSRAVHPDKGGDADTFMQYKQARDDCLKYFLSKEE